MSLRILHVAPYFADAWAYGGIPRVATALTRGLARRGHRLTVCTTDACDAVDRLPERPANADIDVRVFRNLSNTLAFTWQLYLPIGARRYLRGAVRGFDVVHIHAHRHALEAAAAGACRRAGVPYVLSPNGTAPRYERRLPAKRLWDAAWGTRDLHGAARVLAVSAAEQVQLTALGVPADRIAALPNPVDLQEFASEIADRRPPGPPRVAYLGKVTPRKRLDVLVRAMTAIARADARLAIAGSDMGGLHDAVRLAGELGIASRIDRAGTLTGGARLDWLRAADVVVYPSAEEVFGLVPLEALLTGTPVVVADDSGCGQVVGPLAGAQVVPHDDVRAVAAAIDRVLADPPRWRAAARRGAAAIREKYGADAIAGTLESIYRGVLAH
jgi:glycosyltransferase involved in cell wall biosynthesis